MLIQRAYKTELKPNQVQVAAGEKPIAALAEAGNIKKARDMRD